MKKWILIVCLVGLLLVFLPHLVTSGWITPFLQKQTGGEWSIEKSKLGWFGPQRFQGVVFQVDNRRFQIEEFTLYESLFHLLFKQTVNALSFKGLEAELGNTLCLHEVTGEFCPKAVSLHGKTKQGEEEGEIHITGAIPLTLSWRELLQDLKQEGSFEILLTKFPTEILDVVSPQCRFSFAELLGPKMDLSVKRHGADLYFQANSSLVEAALHLFVKADAITIPEEGHIYYQMPNSPLLITLVQGEETHAHFHIEKLSLAKDTFVKQINGTFHATPSLDKAEVEVQGRLEEGGIESPLSLYGTLQIGETPQFTLELTGKEVPVSLIDHFVPARAHALAWIGPHFSGKLTLSSEEEGLLVQLQGDSPRIQVPGLKMSYQNGLIRLKEESHFELAFSPATYAHQVDGELPFTSDIPLIVQLREFEVDLRGCRKKLTPEAIFVDCIVSTKEIAFRTFSFSNLFAEIKGPLDGMQLQVMTRLQMDETIKTTLQGEIAFTPEWQLQINRVQGEAKSTTLTLSFEGYGEKELLTLSLQADQRLFWQVDEQEALHPLQNSNLSLRLDHWQFNPFQPTLKTMVAKGVLGIDHLTIGRGSKVMGAVHNFQLPFQYDGKAGEVSLTITGETESSGKPGTITGDIKITDPWLVQGALHAKQFPVAVLSYLTGADFLSLLLSSGADVDLTVQDEKTDRPGVIAMHMKGQNFQASGAFAIADAVTLVHPIEIEWQLSPERLSAIRKAAGKGDEIKLLTPIFSHLELSALRIPLDNPKKVELSVALAVDEFTLSSPARNETFVVNRIKLDGHADNLRKQFDSDLAIYSSAMKLNVHSTLADLFNSEKRSLQIAGKSEETPLTLLLDALLLENPLFGQVEALLGEKLNSQFNLVIHPTGGVIKADIFGTGGTLSVDGYLQNRIFYLNQDLSASFTLTPALDSSALEEILPLLHSAVRSEQPITVLLHREGFLYPVDQPINMQIGRLKVDLGKIWFKNDRVVAEILSLLNYQAESETLPVWFTPLYMSYSNSVAEVKRLDMLVVDTFPVALWGNVDFGKDRVHLTLGLGGQTLRHAFGLKGVPNNYYLQLPFKGTTANASIDMGNAAPKIAAFIAQFRGGPQGLLFGAVLDLIGGTLGQKKTPKPTTTPFPWEKN